MCIRGPQETQDLIRIANGQRQVVMDHILHSIVSGEHSGFVLSRPESQMLTPAASMPEPEERDPEGPGAVAAGQGNRGAEGAQPSGEAETLVPRRLPPYGRGLGEAGRPWPSFVSTDGSLQDYEVLPVLPPAPNFLCFQQPRT